ncbi:hypothetical protein BS47DRAFT_1381714 [Hydnum rufescens UP504]|uniref:Zn(2)-C6 fungal-type domain-containing protein n=1 Tax=Hydnum rufescens UP504 TaxID=1448309 RepID=A0A9P6B2D4_9AGAM|nr:hypothetical protein BS47DRAFT_1381714 [Hydnum rufescens UP504]
MSNAGPLPHGEACLMCRQHKIKCDAEKPSCGQCLRHRRTCDFAPPLSRTRRLEEKIRRLEEEIRRVEAATASYSTASWSNPLLAPGATVKPAKIDPLLACQPRVSQSSQETAPGECLKLQPAQGPYVCGVSRALIISRLHIWDEKSELNPCLRSKLLAIFLPYRDQFNFDLNPQRLEEAMALPSSNPQSLHPALLNAIFLGACSCLGPEVRRHERIFLDRAREHLNQSLAFVDRLEHFLWASAILGWYWIKNGCIMQAHNISSSITRFAIACELHEISNPAAHMEYTGLLGPPRDLFHIAERINLWWAIYILDRLISLGSALPPGVWGEEREIITTVWPRSWADLKVDYSPANWPRGSINELFIHGTQSTNVTNDSFLSLRAKCYALIDRTLYTSHLARERSPGDAFWTTRLSINNALTRFQLSMPDLYGLRESLEDAGGGEPSAESRTNQVIHPTLFLVKNTILSAAITLHDIDANNDASEYAKCLEAARAMANIARCVKSLPVLYAHICLGGTWYSGAEVLVREIRRNDPPCCPDQALLLRRAQEDLDVMLHVLSELVGYYPSLMVYIHRIASLFSLPLPADL